MTVKNLFPCGFRVTRWQKHVAPGWLQDLFLSDDHFVMMYA